MGMMMCSADLILNKVTFIEKRCHYTPIAPPEDDRLISSIYGQLMHFESLQVGFTRIEKAASQAS